MRFVVDASVAVKLLVDVPDSNAACELSGSGEELRAPRLMASEVANALWRKARAGQIERADAGAALALLPDMPVRWNDDEAVSADAVRPALALDHPVRNCVYLALAHRIGAVMLVADRRFVTAVALSEHGESVLTLVDYAETPRRTFLVANKPVFAHHGTLLDADARVDGQAVQQTRCKLSAERRAAP